MSNIRRKRVICKLVENGRSVSRAMRESGYSKAYSKHPEKFLKTDKAKKELKPILERLKEERDAALEQMRKTRDKAKYNELSNTTEGFTKLLQLLEGKPTEIQEIKDLSEAIKKLAEK